MTKKTSRNWRGLRPDGWTLLTLIIAGLVLLPIVSVVALALFPQDNVWPHLLQTTLPRYLRNTLVLMSAVGVVTALVGAGAAWLVVMYRFPGRSWLQWALLLPLAVPAYVGAYALVDVFEYAGPIQTALRGQFGWSTARDYWFPQIRSMEAAIVVLSAALYPYVYLLTRAALREQSGAAYEVARALGVRGWGRFWRIGLPLTRPAIVAGVAVVMMEAVNDFGTVDYFAVQTLTVGIFSLWQQSGNVGGAAQIACLLLVMILGLSWSERLSRRRGKFYGSVRGARPVTPQPLCGAPAVMASLACALPVLIGFVLPIAALTPHAMQSQAWVQKGLQSAFLHTVTTAGGAAVISVMAAMAMVYAIRLKERRYASLLMPLTAVGYAVPGTVLGLGILIPLAMLDNRMADGWLALTGHDPGLLITGSAAAVMLAYCVRFFAIAQGATDSALGRVSPSLSMAARSLGLSARATLWRVHRPLMRNSIGSAVLLIFVDGVKELPATLMLRPFGYETLATRVHEKASLENITDTAPAALMICAVGLIAVVLLARASR